MDWEIGRLSLGVGHCNEIDLRHVWKFSYFCVTETVDCNINFFRIIVAEDFITDFIKLGILEFWKSNHSLKCSNLSFLGNNILSFFICQKLYLKRQFNLKFQCFRTTCIRLHAPIPIFLKKTCLKSAFIKPKEFTNLRFARSLLSRCGKGGWKSHAHCWWRFLHKPTQHQLDKIADIA